MTAPRVDRRRRVAFIDDHPDVDAGATRWTRTVAKELARRGWQVTIVFPHDGVAVERARGEGIAVSVVTTTRRLQHYAQRLSRLDALYGLATMPRYWLRLRRQLRAVADIVHANDHRGLVFAGPAARLAGTRLVWHVHSANSATSLNWFGSRLANVIVVPSMPTAEACPGLRSDVVVLPNAVDDRWFAAAAAPPDDPHVVVTVGRLHPVKGVDVLLRAAAILRSEGLVFRLQVVGGEQPGHADYAAELRSLVDELGLDSDVDFVGAVDDPAPIVRRAWVYAQPSRFEPGGLALLEAMATGTPVVATAVGGMREVVTDGVDGWLVPPDDPLALADALRQALTTTEVAGIATAGRDRARMFTVDALADQLEELYAMKLAR